MTTLKNRKPLNKISSKPRKCDWCRQEFIRVRLGEKCCSVSCAIAWAGNERVKRDCAPYRAKPKKSAKDRQWWLDATQVDVNKWCRFRDRERPCITCGKPPEASDKFVKGSGRDAGHYLTRSAYSALRFDTRQIFAQCVTCNRFNSGRRHEFRLAMIEMHGLEFVEWLESQRQPKKWDIDELKQIRATYRKRLRDDMRGLGL